MANETLTVQQQITEAIRQRTVHLEDHTKMLREQADIAGQLRENLSEVELSTQSSSRLDDIAQSLQKAADEAETFEDQLNSALEAGSEKSKDLNDKLEDVLKTVGDNIKGIKLWKFGVLGFGFGFFKTFKNVHGILKGAIGLAFSLAQNITRIGVAVASIPFKIFNAFVDEANKTMGGLELMKAFEDIRKMSGDFKTDISKNIIGAVRNMRGELANTGLSVFRVAGIMHERLSLVKELAGEMKADFHLFGMEIAQNAEVMIAFQKGLGLTGDQFKGFAAHTATTNKSLKETLRTVTTFSTKLGKQFGISQKVIARDTGEMVQDLKTFGSVGVKEMAQLSVFSRKLGVDFKELQGIVDQFDNFENAAENAAKLSQAFGLNIDVMKMMNEQDVGKRVDMMRKSFFAAGRSIKDMTRQERNYLAATTGVADSALDQVFALSSQGKSYDEVTKAGSEAEKSQLTTAESMQQLSASIEKIVKQGQRSGGFLDRFILGLTQGVRWSKDFRKTIWNVKHSLWAAERAGRQVGRAFTKSFPGMKTLIEGFKDFFNPKKFRKLATSVVSGFRKFFKELGDPKTAQKALDNLFNTFTKGFFTMAGDQESAIGKITAGFKRGFQAMGQVALSAGRIVLENITKGLKAVFKAIKDPNLSISDALADAFGQVGDVGTGLFTDIVTSIKTQLGPASKALMKVGSEMISYIWEGAKPKIERFFDELPGKIIDFATENPKVAMWMAAIFFGPAFAQGAASMIGATAFKVAGSAGTKLFAKAMGTSIGQKAIGAMSGIFGNSLSAFTSMGSKAGGSVATGMSGKLTTSMSSMFGKAGPLAAVVAAGIGGWAIGSWIDDKIGASDMLAGGPEMKGRRIKMEDSSMQEAINSFEVVSNKRELAGRSLNRALSQAAKLDEETGSLAQKSISEINKALESRKDLSASQQRILMNVVKSKSEKEYLSKLAVEFSRIENNTGGWTGFSESKARKLKDSYAKRLKEQMEKQGTYWGDEAQKGLSSIMGKSAAESRKRISEQGKLAAATADVKKRVAFATNNVSDGDLDLYNQIKKINPNKVAKTIRNFNEKVKPLLIGKDGQGGLRQTMAEIGKAFDDETIGRSALAVESIKNFERIGSTLTVLTSDFSKMEKKVNKVVGKGDAKNIPLVNAVLKMVSIANIMNKELSSIDKINLRPKLENLGRLLGFGGKDAVKIENQNFQINVDVQVTLDSDELSQALVETGNVQAGPKNNRSSR